MLLFKCLFRSVLESKIELNSNKNGIPNRDSLGSNSLKLANCSFRKYTVWDKKIMRRSFFWIVSEAFF